MRSRPLLLLLAAAVVLAAACGGHSHHGTPSPTPTPAAPVGVVATPGFQQLAISWTPVGGASDYRVYVSTSPIASDSALTPTATNLTHFTATGLTDWIPYHVRVQADDNGRLGPLSDEVIATPTGGVEVALLRSSATFTLAAIRSDEANTRVWSVPDASLFLPKGVGVTTTGFTFTSGPVGDAVTTVGWATATSATTFAAEAGHGYHVLGVGGTPSRILVYDQPSAPPGMVRSYAPGGGDPKILATGCAASPQQFQTGPAGIVFVCSVGGIRTAFASDGSSPAVSVAMDLDPENVSPLGGYFHDTSTGEILLLPFDGSAISGVQTGAVDYQLKMVGMDRLLLEAQGASGYSLDSTDLDGGNLAFVALNAPNGFGVSPEVDGQAAVTTDPATSHAFLAPLALGASNVDISGGVADDLALVVPPTGRILVQPAGADWRLFDYPSGAPLASFAGTANDSFVFPGSGFVMLYQYPDVFVADTSTATGAFVTSQATNAAIWSDGEAIWNDDASPSALHVSRADGTGAMVLGTSQLGFASGYSTDGRHFATLLVQGTASTYSVSPAGQLALVAGSNGAGSAFGVLWMP